MKKTALVVLIIAAVVMMIGGQSALAEKPAGTVGRIANGKVTEILSSLAPGPGPLDPVTASGPWKLVVHLKTGEINFSATCKTAAGVVKYSAIGPATTIDTSVLGVVSITGVAFSVKMGTATQAFSAGVLVQIVVNNNLGTLYVDVNSSGLQNIWGNVRDLKAVP